jgi:archaemetzincin
MEVGLVWIGTREVGGAVLDHVRDRVELRLRCETAWVPSREGPADSYDARRGQHASAALLRFLDALEPAPAPRLLGVTDADLFIPVLTFVFGEARLGGRAAVVSTARLGPPGPLLAERLAKEAVHELGHTYGLLHCDIERCVMLRSPTLRDVDAKSDELCRDCRSRLNDARRERTP